MSSLEGARKYSEKKQPETGDSAKVALLEQQLLGSEMRAAELQRILAATERELVDQSYMLHLIFSSRSWKITSPIRRATEYARKFKRRLFSNFKALKYALKSGDISIFIPAPQSRYFRYPRDPVYAAWIKKNEPLEKDAVTLRSENLSYSPKISVLLPVYNPPEQFLREALESVRRQYYGNWELCIADDASSAPYVRKVLTEFEKLDSRIKVVYRERNGHISEASNSALTLVTGEYVALLDHDDQLAPHALLEIVRALQGISRPDLIYSNEDKIDVKNERCEPTFKAAWSPDYFRSFMYIGHLSVYRTSLVQEVGGFRKGLEGSQDYDLALRVSERAKKIVHIPHILYHWRKHEESVASNIHAKPYAFNAATKALRDAMERNNSQGEIEYTSLAGVYRSRYRMPKQAKLTVFLYFRRGTGYVEAIERLRAAAPCESFERIVGCIDPDRSTEEQTSSGETVLFSPAFEDRAQFWKIALARTNSELIFLLDGELAPLDDFWMKELIGEISRDEIAAVSPKLVMPDLSIFNAGYTVIGTQVRHRFYGVTARSHGYALRLSTANNVSALCSSALILRAKDLAVHLEAGYLSQAAGDVSLALSLQASGRRLLWTPHTAFKYMGRRPCAKTDLALVASDLSRLKEKGFCEGPDSFYPPGLDQSGDFTIAL